MRLRKVIYNDGDPILYILLKTNNLGFLKEEIEAAERRLVSTPNERTRLARQLEPRAPNPKRRLAAISALSARGVPTGCMFAPVIPGLSDHELDELIERVRGVFS